MYVRCEKALLYILDTMYYLNGATPLAKESRT